MQYNGSCQGNHAFASSGTLGESPLTERTEPLTVEAATNGIGGRFIFQEC